MISIDFWNTIAIAHTNGEKRHIARLTALTDLAAKYEKSLSIKEIKKAHAYASEKFDEIWLGTSRTPTTEELVSITVDYLGLKFSDDDLHRLTFVYQKSLLDGPPEVAIGAADALKELSQKHKLAIISDTMFSPGTILRDYLHSKGIGKYFSAFAFSDEVGVSKPHPKMYEKVLSETSSDPKESFHIGDIHQTDIAGAQQMGMKAVLYTGVNKADEKTTTADFVTSNWHEIPSLILK